MLETKIALDIITILYAIYGYCNVFLPWYTNRKTTPLLHPHHCCTHTSVLRPFHCNNGCTPASIRNQHPGSNIN